MDWEIWEPHPHRYFLRNIYFGIEIRGPFIEIQSLGTHEVRAASEDKISVFFGYKFEDEEPSSKRVAGNTVLELRSPVPLDPIVSGSCGGPKPHELPNQSTFS